MKLHALMMATLALLTACASPMSSNIRRRSPSSICLPTSSAPHAWGMFQRRGGTVVKRFKVEITGTGDARQLTLDERFRYDDGTTQRRVWHLTRGADGRWLGRADDVEGEAQGEVAGNALHWQYTLLLPIDGSTYAMRFDDWMFLIDDCTMISRASMAKLGIELGQVTLMFRKANCPA
jgi:hypothetical protein